MKDDLPPPEPDTSNDVPAYIVTFSDMVTLLLTFFVMLLSLADVQDPELFNKGRDSFVQSLQHCGLGVLMSGPVTPGLQAPKEKFKSRSDDPNATRTIDGRREARRQAFERLNELMTTASSQLVADRVDYTPLNIRFSGTDSRLSDAARETVWQFARNLRPPASGKKKTMYVLGLAKSSDPIKDSWVLSAQRAEAVATFLRRSLSKNQWNIYSWGAGLGQDWAGQRGRVADHTEIMVGVLQNES